MHVEFDATLDEAADVQLRLSRRTSTYKRYRRLNQSVVGVVFALVLAGTIFGRLGGRVHLGPYLLVMAFAIASGVVVGKLYGRFNDAWVLRYAKHSIAELNHGRGPFRTEFEVRPGGLWVKSNAMEVTLPWTNLVSVGEPAGDVELTFNPGLAVIRARAFESADHRRRFVDAIRAVAPPQAVQPPA